MWGAIIGDIAGSIYEYNQIKSVKPVKIKELIPENGFFSDDSILTVAIADAILNNCEYEKYLRLYGKRFEIYKPKYEPYFNTIFSPGFTKWINGESEGKSAGNGAMMRISPVGYMFNTEEEVITNAKLATIPSHNSSEAINCATKIALIIFYSRMGKSKKEIIDKLNLNIKFEPFSEFNMTCGTTIDNCIFASFSSESFEESIEKVISFGGDTDTNACIVGAMSEAMYGVNKEIIEKAKTIVPKEFIDVIENEYKKPNDYKDYER